MALTDNIIGYWKLDESSGNAADSVASNTLTNNGTTGYVAGKINNAGDLGASNTTKWFSSTSNSTVGSGAFSMNMWINVTTAPSGQNMQLFNVGNSTNFLTYAMYYREVGAGPLLRWERVRDGVATATLSASNDLGTGTWYMVTYTYAAGGTITGYLNATSQGTASQTGDGTSSTTNGITLGASIYDSLQKFSGIVDEVGLWTRELTGSEVTQLYNSGAGLAYPFSSGAAIRDARNLPLLGVG